VEVTSAVEPSVLVIDLSTLATLLTLSTVTVAEVTWFDAAASVWTVVNGISTSESANVEPEL